jgi:hypothetical protein
MVLTLIALFSLWSQPVISSSAEIYGQVTDVHGSPVSNAEVLACKGVPCSKGPKRIGKTDGSGMYSFKLPPGTYEFRIKGEMNPIWVSINGNRQDIKLKKVIDH